MEITKQQLKQYYQDGLTMIWQYKTLYQINYSQNTGIGYRKIARKPKTDFLGVTRRGRYKAMKPDEAITFLGVNYQRLSI